MIHAVKDLTPEQRQAVESLLGRAVDDNEAVSLKSVWTPATGTPPSTPEQRHEAAEWLERHYAKVAARQRSYSDQEFEATIAEALQAARSESGPSN
ncbi:MAG: hypothetical protein FJW38_13445 [Acidobacteria bacterium]|nr:hypothetical protein [Acidobacteriota bacterium]